MLTVPDSRSRQQRLLQVMQRRKLDAIVVGHPKHVYYFSAYLTLWLHQTAFVLFADGTSALIAAENSVKDPVAADKVIPFAARRIATLRPDQPVAVADQVMQILAEHHTTRVGVDTSEVSMHCIQRLPGPATNIDSELQQLRRRKDSDELVLVTKAIQCAQAMYQRAREIIEPGIPEIQVFAELQKSAVLAADEPLSDPLGNDFVCGRGGGPPRPGKRAESGQLYILDLGPAYRGYYSDSARVFSVDRKPTDKQLAARQAIVDALKLGEGMAKPGTRCKDLFAAVDEHLRKQTGRALTHHLGHGVGLQPHEHPYLNPQWDDVLLEGEIFTMEPGTYASEIGGGVRLENLYLVTASGVKNLLDFPLDLV